MSTTALTLLWIASLFGYLLVGSLVAAVFAARTAGKHSDEYSCCYRAWEDGKLNYHLFAPFFDGYHYLGWWFIAWPVLIVGLPFLLVYAGLYGIFKVMIMGSGWVARRMAGIG